MADEKKVKAEFEMDEVLKIKNYLFKVVLIDGMAGKLALKQISPEEARYLENLKAKKEA